MWRLELQEDGCYRIQNCADSKMLTVSGAAQLAGTQVFMAQPDASTAQSFGLYFDNRAHADYTAAKMFSAGYYDDNAKAIEAQNAYESAAGVADVAVDAATNVVPDGRDALLVSTGVAADVRISVYDAVSGRLICAFDAHTAGAYDHVSLPSPLAPGVYLVAVGGSVSKICVK